MWIPNKTGVLLHRIDTPVSDKIVINLIRKELGAAGQQFANFSIHTTALTLHIKKHEGSCEGDGCESYKLDYDPWSDINVIPDGSIDEKDIDAIAQLALVFYHQTVIDPSAGIFLAVLPVDAPRLLVRIEVLDREDSERPELDYFFNATSFDEGENFEVRTVDPHSGPSVDDSPGLENLARAFIKLKL